MKKKLFLSVVCIMLMSLGLGLSGCGSGETYDAGNVSCAVPDGWKVFTSEEVSSDNAGDSADKSDQTAEEKKAAEENAKDEAKDNAESDKDPNSIYIYKGAEQASDMPNTNGITILYSQYGLMGTFDDMKDYYENCKDQKPLKLSNYEWKWFTGDQFEGKYEFAVLAAEDGDAAIQVSVLLKNGEKTISMDDDDVKEILESIKITGSED